MVLSPMILSDSLHPNIFLKGITGFIKTFQTTEPPRTMNTGAQLNHLFLSKLWGHQTGGLFESKNFVQEPSQLSSNFPIPRPSPYPFFNGYGHPMTFGGSKGMVPSIVFFFTHVPPSVATTREPATLVVPGHLTKKCPVCTSGHDMQIQCRYNIQIACGE